MQAETFEVTERRKRITIFKVRGHWVFKHYFDKETFRELAGNYDKENYRFEIKTIGEMNRSIKLMEKRGFDVELVENLRGYLVRLDRYSRYADVLKNSVHHIETPEWRIFLMKDLAAVEEAVRIGAKNVEVDVRL